MEQKAKKNRNEGSAKRRRLAVYALVLLVAVCGVSGGLLARYVTQNRQQAEMISAGFHISSDFLKENGPTYSVSTTGDLIVHLYNYEVENTAQISQVAMAYTVTVEGGTLAKLDETSVGAATTSSTFVKSDDKAFHTLTITPSASTVSVTVQTTSPYGKTLSATFNRTANATPVYTFTNQGNGTGLLTVKTNEFAGSVTVDWAEGRYSPDNTNRLMEEWLDSNGRGSFTAAANSTYELLFVRKTESLTETADWTNATVSGDTAAITLN